MTLFKYKIINSLVGPLTIVARDAYLIAILWDNEKEGRVVLDPMKEDLNHPVLLKTERQLQDYFLQKKFIFDIPIQIEGTVFQKTVWQALALIPYGATWSYKEIAQKIGHPNAVRAVGTAIGKNPISIILPCHRVIASNGSLAGFAGGLHKKQILLNLEKSAIR
ncbi:MAG TPA: methylated-DNA--[protein]-cysteine S-methyltransferase [Parachlamydiaceae bacterium]|nr:methylated-DNA--[protein]-cysteine S-methyltransferase [Parachlamydiaceae bacterium]